jgi:hypothetical protein
MPHRKAPCVRHDDPTKVGQRARNLSGELRRKRGDARVDTLEEQYHVDCGVRGDMTLKTLRQRLGEDEVAKLVRRTRE